MLVQVLPAENSPGEVHAVCSAFGLHLPSAGLKQHPVFAGVCAVVAGRIKEKITKAKLIKINAESRI